MHRVPDVLAAVRRCVVVIPAHQEESRIGAVVRECLRSPVEVWVIDDGSKDETGRVAAEAGARVLSHPVNLGKGRAIRTALQEFRKEPRDYLLFLDGDGQHDPAAIPSFITRAESTGADIVLGNRMLLPLGMPPVRQLTNFVMSWLISQMAGQDIPDSQCGYRMLSRRFVEAFAPTTERFELESEMLIQAGRMGMDILSVPIPVIYAGESSHIDPVTDTIRFIRMVWQYLRD